MSIIEIMIDRLKQSTSPLDANVSLVKFHVMSWQKRIVQTGGLGNLLIEDGSFLLLESGDNLVLEA